MSLTFEIVKWLYLERSPTSHSREQISSRLPAPSPQGNRRGESLVKPRISKGDTVLGGEAELRHTLFKRQAYFTAVRKHTFLYEALEIFYSVHIQAF
jgi:hypothetical protein